MKAKTARTTARTQVTRRLTEIKRRMANTLKFWSVNVGTFQHQGWDLPGDNLRDWLMTENEITYTIKLLTDLQHHVAIQGSLYRDEEASPSVRAASIQQRGLTPCKAGCGHNVELGHDLHGCLAPDCKCTLGATVMEKRDARVRAGLPSGWAYTID